MGRSNHLLLHLHPHHDSLRLHGLGSLLHRDPRLLGIRLRLGGRRHGLHQDLRLDSHRHALDRHDRQHLPGSRRLDLGSHHGHHHHHRVHHGRLYLDQPYRG